MRMFLAITLFAALGVTSIRAEPPSAPTAFAVTVTGQGKDAILIPGLNSSGAVWDGTVAQLKDRYRCRVLTLAGFAGQLRVDGVNLETVRNQLAAYIRAQHLDRPVIIGHSLGGFVALWLASHDPDLVGPLVIVDSLPYLPAAYNPAATVENSAAMAALMRDALAKGGEDYQKRAEASMKTMVTSPANVELLNSWSKASDPVASGSAVYDLFTHDLRADIAHITAPTLVLGTWRAYSTNDADTAPRDMVDRSFRAQYALLQGVKIVLADHARHFIMLDDPAWFYVQVNAFLSNAGTPAKPSTDAARHIL